ncbi:MAG: hypothetical protein GY697_02550 [Desulfobacterales bacterium]|nr:hypothetical protein [Desulfobacterales bacterium]
MSHKKSPKELAKILEYILGRHPAEFGLVPDRTGYVRIKELLKVFSEEEGWHYVRRSHLDEVILTLPDRPVEFKDNLIRAKNRENLPSFEEAAELPKLLYTCVRQKAYPFVAAKGVQKSDGDIVLSADPDIARRIGKRIDQKPVLLTVQVKKTLGQRVCFFTGGGTLFTAACIPAGCFTGPPLPKEKPDLNPPENMIPATPKRPGSYTIKFNKDGALDSSTEKDGRTKDPPWKKKRKRAKERHEKPPWRR